MRERPTWLPPFEVFEVVSLNRLPLRHHLMRGPENFHNLSLILQGIGECGSCATAIKLKDIISACRIMAEKADSDLARIAVNDKDFYSLFCGEPLVWLPRLPTLTEALRNATALMSLNFLNVGLDHTHLALLAEGLCCNKSLMELNLTGNAFEAAGHILARILRSNTTITRLCIGSSAIDGACAVEIAAGLVGATVLTTLGLRDNPVGLEGVRAIATALPRTLTYLDLGMTRLGPDSAAVLSRMLAHNTTLLVLILAHNSIGSVGVAALAGALASNTTLATLDLTANAIDAAGACALAAALHSNVALTSLELRDNAIDYRGAEALIAALEFNMFVKHIGLTGNHAIASDLVARLERLLDDAGRAAAAAGQADTKPACEMPRQHRE
eukprot:m.202932 g.202932  ORF g.202932 m.202932 type:complete len:385 (+) comp15516_c0_seq1:174-1328(+)